MSLDHLKSQYFDGVYKSKAFLIKEQPFILQSGKQSHLYLNHRNFLSQSNYLALVANIYHELAKKIELDYQ
jgi:orotate phosphoribosyltransferase